MNRHNLHDSSLSGLLSLLLILAEVMLGLRKMMPSAQSLLVFEAAARLQSFKAAAPDLHVTQPSVSQTSRAMEDQLGLRLFDRQNRGGTDGRSCASAAPDRKPAAQPQDPSQPDHYGRGFDLGLGAMAAADHGAIST